MKLEIGNIKKKFNKALAKYPKVHGDVIIEVDHDKVVWVNLFATQLNLHPRGQEIDVLAKNKWFPFDHVKEQGHSFFRLSEAERGAVLDDLTLCAENHFGFMDWANLSNNKINWYVSYRRVGNAKVYCI